MRLPRDTDEAAAVECFLAALEGSSGCATIRQAKGEVEQIDANILEQSPYRLLLRLLRYRTDVSLKPQYELCFC
jgi:hypothetical protein